MPVFSSNRVICLWTANAIDGFTSIHRSHEQLLLDGCAIAASVERNQYLCIYSCALLYIACACVYNVSLSG